MSGSIFGIAVTGLNSAKAALETTSHNIGNVNTQGYTRQSTDPEGQRPAVRGLWLCRYRGQPYRCASRL